jgi:two-component system cell cycle response regulator
LTKTLLSYTILCMKRREVSGERILLRIAQPSFVLFIILFLIFLTAHIESFVSFGTILRHALFYAVVPVLLIIFSFRIISYYYHLQAQSLSYLKIIHNAQVILLATEDMEDFLVEVLDIFCRLFRGQKALLFVVDPQLKRFVKNDEFVIDFGLSQRKAKSHSIKLFNPTVITESCQKKLDAKIREHGIVQATAAAIVPVLNKSSIAAIAVVGTEFADKRFFERLQEPIDIFTRLASSALENALLRQEISEIAITDALTTLYNRRFFQKKLKEELSRAKRNQFPLTVMISDLDNFKYYVDTFGHPEGDRILHDIAVKIKACLREEDSMCRFGGDEFAYIFPMTDALEAITAAERIKTMLSSDPLIIDGKKTYISLSMGIASFPEHGEIDEELLKRADTALFSSKRSGKNQVSVYRDYCDEVRNGSKSKDIKKNK